ncbi:hypothetical protein [Xenorhabdus hominickii]|uniref:Uncharacterized protein n=1 Tax=Xenorhabdus hominickii TaxID=351679 RepID=A0A2G0Q2L9_XENHO|nr:hypothetical protein [Xenorhabdus hominickii]AOM39694.1 hypothetical protein A9255_03275 [Xenorhabdus hominickii]PHM53455.1 hypothetical protein Xhom_03453 [Xenorhabdus hominickii]
MAPNLISSYSKDLSKKPSYVSRSVIDEYYHLSSEDDDLLKITEYALVGSEYHYYSEIVYMGCSTPNFYSEHAERLRECGYHTEHIINELISLDMHEPSENILVGRIAYSDFNFVDKKTIKTGKQIKAVYIDKNFRGVGIASSIYNSLLLKHEYIICDSIQSLSGGSLWASKIIELGEVRIYDVTQKKFSDVLTPRGIGMKGIIPWSAVDLPPSELSKWEPRPLSPESCHHIVNIISKDKLYN